jgi:putative transposase
MYCVKKLIDAERKLLPRLGTRKLYHRIKPLLAEQGIKIGRDKLFNWMREYDLLLKPKRRYVQTTMSKHWMRKYPNLVSQVKITAPEQVWVSDITYIKTREGNCYLNMVTDAYSRKIMGYAVEDNMETSSMIEALTMAIKQCHPKQQKPIHHSDRGVQYCSKEYVKLLTDNNIQISMTQNGDPYENALAERMNRTIKEEFGLDGLVNTKQQVKKVVSEAVELYNNRRPHLSLKMKTPQMVHQQKIPITLQLSGLL